MQQAEIWLNNNSHPWELLCQKWQITRKKRLADFQNIDNQSTLQELLERWPRFKDPTGYHLVTEIISDSMCMLAFARM